ncbi:hypothetical protein BC826DRAFT_970530 [Russula brevipes]|nr:hypothetical protein BC826DRAFT_970530 [Russula brevipes]
MSLCAWWCCVVIPWSLVVRTLSATAVRRVEGGGYAWPLKRRIPVKNMGRERAGREVRLVVRRPLGVIGWAWSLSYGYERFEMVYGPEAVGAGDQVDGDSGRGKGWWRSREDIDW